MDTLLSGKPNFQPLTGKYAKAFKLEWNFAKFLYNYTKCLGEARLTKGNLAQRLEEILVREDDRAKGDGVYWCSERTLKKQALPIGSKWKTKTWKFSIFYLFILFYLLLLQGYKKYILISPFWGHSVFWSWWEYVLRHGNVYAYPVLTDVMGWLFCGLLETVVVPVTISYCITTDENARILSNLNG